MMMQTWWPWKKTSLIYGEGDFAAEDDDGNVKGIQDIEDDDQELNVEEDRWLWKKYYKKCKKH
jgi:hypothetical protein